MSLACGGDGDFRRRNLPTCSWRTFVWSNGGRRMKLSRRSGTNGFCSCLLCI